MSFDFPIHIPDNSPEARVIEAIVKREHVSPEEVVRRAIRSLQVPPIDAKPRKRKSANGELLTDEMINQLKALDSSYGLLEDLSEKEFKAIEAAIRRSKREGFPKRA